jgi:hypothetical protein
MSCCLKRPRRQPSARGPAGYAGGCGRAGPGGRGADVARRWPRKGSHRLSRDGHWYSLRMHPYRTTTLCAPYFRSGAPQPVFQRRKFFLGRAIYGEGIQGISWLDPSGQDMTEDAWIPDMPAALGCGSPAISSGIWTSVGSRLSVTPSCSSSMPITERFSSRCHLPRRDSHGSASSIPSMYQASPCSPEASNRMCCKAARWSSCARDRCTRRHSTRPESLVLGKRDPCRTVF